MAKFVDAKMVLVWRFQPSFLEGVDEVLILVAFPFQEVLRSMEPIYVMSFNVKI